jgi:hypothetical protein
MWGKRLTSGMAAISVATLAALPAIGDECRGYQCYVATPGYPSEHDHSHNDTQQPYPTYATPSNIRGVTGPSPIR